MHFPETTRDWVKTFFFAVLVTAVFYQPFYNFLNNWAREDCLRGHMGACNWVEQIY